MVRFIHDDELEPGWVQLLQPVDVVQGLISSYCPAPLDQLEHAFKTRFNTHTSAIPLADLFDCSTSTLQSGPSNLFAAPSACAASSTLLTTIRTLPFSSSALSFRRVLDLSTEKRGMRFMNIVVLPLPVGEETPIRVFPAAIADKQASMADSW